jgi:CDP-glucose 4,6-dehydratase
LDCIAGYLLYAESLATDRETARALNFGPSRRIAVTVAELAEELLKALRRKPEWDYAPEHDSSELSALEIDASSAREVLNWHDRLAGQKGIAWTADWYRAHAAGADMRQVSLDQIVAYSELRSRK